MVASFCLRLAFGLVAALTLLSPAQVHPRFFRVQYLIALGLLAVTAFFVRDLAGLWVWVPLAAAMVSTFVGSILWHVEGHPGQRIVFVWSSVSLAASLVLGGLAVRGDRDTAWLVGDDFASAAVLGSATSAMLMGHSYLIAPAMSLTPLIRLLAALGVSLLVRMVLAAVGLYWWTSRPSAGNLETEMILWLGVRWVLGFVGPVVLGWMAWETARIHSTQSATGILYVVVILGFLGELTSLLLLEKTGAIL